MCAPLGIRVVFKTINTLRKSERKTILVVIDAYSKWIVATCTASTSSAAVINELQTLFSKFGFLETIVT